MINIRENLNKTIINNSFVLITLLLLIAILFTLGYSSAASISGNISKQSSDTVHLATSQENMGSDLSRSANFTLQNEFRDAGQNGYPNPGKVVNQANYTKWVWTNIIIKNNGPNDSNITIKDTSSGFIFYNPEIGWNGWVRYNDGTGWKKDTNFDFKTGTGTYHVQNGSSYQIAILGYVNQTGTIRNDVKEIYQDTLGPDIYPSTFKILNIPDAAIIRLNGEFRTSLSGSPIKSADYEDWIYSVTSARNQGPNNTNAIFKIITYGLNSNGTYAVSRDNGKTWKFNDGTFNYGTGIWQTNIPSNGNWLLAVYSQVTKAGTLNSTAYLLSQDVYNPYGTDNSRPKCLIVFDDGNEAQYSTAFKYMISKGITGTVYINGFNIGEDGVLNIAQLQEMANAGWIIGSHAFNHIDLTLINSEDVYNQIYEGINYLNSIGLSEGAYHLAYPGGYYNNNVLDIMQSLGVLTGRTTTGQLMYSLNGYDLYRIPGYTILSTTTVSSVKGYVDEAIRTGSTVILLFHDLGFSSTDTYIYPENNFKAIIDYIQSTGIDCLNIDQLYTQSTELPINIPPYDLESTTILPGVTFDELFNITSQLNVPIPTADVEIKINSSNKNPQYGDRITLTIKVINNGPDTAENVTVGEWFDGDYFKYISDDSNGTFNPENSIWYVGDLENGESKFLNVVVQILTSNTTITNIATYNSGSTDDSNLNNNYHTVELTVPPRTFISVNPVTGYMGDSVDIVVILRDENNQPLNNKLVHLTINGITITTTTDSSGTAIIPYTIIQYSGIYNITADFDQDDDFSSSTDTNFLNVMHIPTFITLNNTNGYHGDKINLTAILTDKRNNAPIKSGIIIFKVNNVVVGTATTDNTGKAELPYLIKLNSGSYNVTATLKPNDTYLTSNTTGILDILSSTTSIKINSTKGYAGEKNVLTARIMDTHTNTYLSNKSILFYVNGRSIGTAKTNSNGTAILPYIITQNSGSYNISAIFNRDINYLSCNAISVLTVLKTPTSIIVNSSSGYIQDQVKLIAKVTDTHNKGVVSGKIVNFYVSNVFVGSAVTNKLGIVNLPYKINKTLCGSYTIRGIVVSDGKFIGSTGKNNLIVKRSLTTLSSLKLTAKTGNTVNFQTVLMDSKHNIGLEGKIVKFYLSGKLIGKSTTNNKGIANLQYKSGSKVGLKTLKVYFASDKNFVGSSSSKIIRIYK